MKKQIALFSIVAAALIALPALSRAADKTPAAPAAADQVAPAKKHGLPFHGKISAVDTAAATITVGELKLSITSETKLTKDGKPATLADFAAGDSVAGSYKKDGDKLKVTTMHNAKKKKAE